MGFETLEGSSDQSKLPGWSLPPLEFEGEQIKKEEIANRNSFNLMKATSLSGKHGDYFVCEIAELGSTKITANFSTTPTMTKQLKRYLEDEKKPLPCEVKVVYNEEKDYYSFEAP